MLRGDVSAYCSIRSLDLLCKRYDPRVPDAANYRGSAAQHLILTPSNSSRTLSEQGTKIDIGGRQLHCPNFKSRILLGRRFKHFDPRIFIHYPRYAIRARVGWRLNSGVPRRV